MKEQIERGLLKLGVSVPDHLATDKLERFILHLLEKNKVMNLTAITEVEQVVGLHLLDSAVLVNFIPNNAKTLIDVGTGAGFPGVPLKILLPDLEITLMDALQKRLSWLEEVGEELELENLKFLHGRGEDLPHRVKYREVYDIATARAVANLTLLSELVLPFVKVGGKFLAMKSRDTGGEIESARNAIDMLGGVITEVTDYKIPDMDVAHRIVMIDKVRESPEDYPRRWAKMKNTPL